MVLINPKLNGLELLLALVEESKKNISSVGGVRCIPRTPASVVTILYFTELDISLRSFNKIATS